MALILYVIIDLCYREIRGVHMDLDKPSKDNLKFILNELADHLTIANRAIMDPDDYDLNKYEDLKFMYDVVKQKGQLSVSESQAFVEELRAVRKN
ncbi:uncharacterized protein YfkK (UPF0435 family) [Virgibacillus campisalis]|uniref:Uncharacterized protein YfkK (UPF0435 family) n=2 Tax=Virgibacillus alimentarius TaxID=698769 RepID=A0ABS4S3U6_9BACI|nr:uncharacterized protein YfkK (UPF0435 family) [Virgibacillus alimentarius]